MIKIVINILESLFIIPVMKKMQSNYLIVLQNVNVHLIKNLQQKLFMEEQDLNV